MLFKRAVIVGTGLIGGSLALAMKKNRCAGEIVGISRKKQTITRALSLGAIDRGSCSLEAARGADFLVLATPVSVMMKQARSLGEIVSKECVVTDVGSTKLRIVDCMEKFFPRFIGSHPLAGSEQRGIASADVALFNGSVCVLTPTKSSQRQALGLVEAVWRKTGARIVRMSPEAHDEALSFTSHLPHAVAFALMNAIPDKFLALAAGGLKDTTRVASSDEEIWADIFLSNKERLLAALDAFGTKLYALEKALKRNDAAALKNLFSHARRKRSKLPLH